MYGEAIKLGFQWFQNILNISGLDCGSDKRAIGFDVGEVAMSASSAAIPFICQWKTRANPEVSSSGVIDDQIA